MSQAHNGWNTTKHACHDIYCFQISMTLLLFKICKTNDFIAQVCRIANTGIRMKQDLQEIDENIIYHKNKKNLRRQDMILMNI